MPDNEAITINVEVNGEDRRLGIPARMTLADALRDELGLTGTHLGCEHGVCGSCTVLLDDRSARSCITLAVQVDGRRVTTIEGLSDDGALTPLQQAFATRGGLQCGFCTPGFVVAATELLRTTPDPDEAAVRSALSGNTCRCTGYESIVDAVLDRGDAAGAQVRPTWPDHGPEIGANAPDAPPGPTEPALASPDQARPAGRTPAVGPEAGSDAGSDAHPDRTPGNRTTWLIAAGVLLAGGVGVWVWERLRGSAR